jgi:hypothetical protein
MALVKAKDETRVATQALMATAFLLFQVNYTYPIYPTQLV